LNHVYDVHTVWHSRRMFPVWTVTLSGLHPDTSYDVLLDMIPVDGLRYRYSFHRSCWLPTGRVDGSCCPREELAWLGPSGNTGLIKPSISYHQPSEPTTRTTSSNTAENDDTVNRQSGCQTIAFDRLKLTNCPKNCNTHVSKSRLIRLT